ncbi:hypothetical protein CWO91_31150 [Bradyrhizobium genosp. SA-3]|uniref:glycoside hydrolase domain-containing protein n=1 Tax=Bradyrhizobium genosp. SA-3 TaxID=508868 RepID=UPI0010298C97|nr:glycoside hydrolase domain-containing protein [Bradyrhizobium genosp. SA-3]RZN04512.1 hypothetical protein CWO91_31150 [Bradyrhizobium genosp. SA-3]
MPFYAGFDILEYPKIAMMDWLNANTNLYWCGYYLAPAPNRPTSQWMGNYSRIKNKWGILPIYVGQQDERTGHDGYEPSSTLTTAQGEIDGEDACDLLAGEGFPRGSFVYLDWEYGGLDGEGSSDYIRSWVSAVAADGRAQPGIYCSHVVAKPIADIIDTINPTPWTRFFCWKVSSANPHDFTGDIAHLPELNPTGCGFAGAQIWQREQQAIVKFPSGTPVTKLMMDFGTSSLTDPGAPSETSRMIVRASLEITESTAYVPQFARKGSRSVSKMEKAQSSAKSKKDIAAAKRKAATKGRSKATLSRKKKARSNKSKRALRKPR